MQLQKNFVPIILALSFCFPASAAEPTPEPLIQKINAQVEVIANKTQTGEYGLLSVEEKGISEGSEPSLEFYFDKKTGQLVAASCNLGLEVRAIKNWYYFDAKSELIKYTHEVHHVHSDQKSPKMAVIYANKKILWSNLQGPLVMPPSEVVKLFASIQKSRKKIGQ